jgi:hypothetical protein
MHWISVTRDSDSFNDSLQWMLNPNTTGESARLRDLHFLNIERRPRVLLKMSATFAKEQSAAQSPALVMDYSMPTRPSCQPLPVPWKTE